MKDEKKSRGRPEKPKEKRKTLYAKARVTVEELETLKANAKALGLSLSDYLLKGKLRRR